MEKPKSDGGGRQLVVEFLTGLFFITAMVLLVLGTVLVKGKKIFGEEHIIKARFPRIGTLSVSDKVRVIGQEMGVVEAIDMNKDFNSVEVTMSLNKNVPLFQDYIIAVKNSSVFGGSYVSIEPGGEQLAGGIVVKKLNKFGTDGDSIVFSGKPPIDILNEASQLIDALKADEAHLRKTIIEGNLFEKIASAADSFSHGAKRFDDFMDKIKHGEGSLGKLINDPSLYDGAKKMLISVNDASESVNILFSDIKSGKGTLGKLLYDDRAYNDMMASINDIKRITGDIAEGKGTLGKLVNDDALLYDTMYDSLRTANELVSQLKGGEGTLGKLLTDDTLYVDVKETVRQIRAAVEDYREQAPVATFGSMVLGAL